MFLEEPVTATSLSSVLIFFQFVMRVHPFSDCCVWCWNSGQTARAEERGGYSLAFDLEPRGGHIGSSVESCSTCLLRPWKHRLGSCFYNCNWVYAFLWRVVSQNCIMFCLEWLQRRVTVPRKYAFPSQDFIWYLYWKFHCVRLKLTMNASLDCFQKLFRNSLDIKNCNCQMIPKFVCFMSRISFIFLIKEDNICQLPIKELRGREDCTNIHFIKPFQGEEPSIPTVIRTNVTLTEDNVQS